MGKAACAICGKPAAPHHRYCTDCDFQARPSADGAALATPGGAVVARRGGEVRLFFFVFLLTALATTLVGVTATTGFSFPAIKAKLGMAGIDSIAAPRWGEIRFVHSATRIRADRTTSSAILGRLLPGDSVRVDFGEAGWFAVFPADAVSREVTEALGFVYAPLLKEAPPGGGSGATR